MTAEPANPSLPHPPDRRPAVWPWLLMPLVALTMYFVLSSIREGAKGPVDGSSPIAAPAHTDSADSGSGL